MPSIFAKAFRGELVPQDPKDESAVLHLERIRAKRMTEVTGAKKGEELNQQGLFVKEEDQKACSCRSVITGVSHGY
jgi:hypothetical protein